MSLASTPERDELRATIRRFIDNHGGLDRARDATNGRYRPGDEFWRRLATDLALPGLILHERHGGSGAGYQELGVAFEELGRRLVPEPLFASLALAAPILSSVPASADIDELCRGLAAGERIVALAWTEPDRPWEPEPLATKARPDGNSWKVSGAKRFVLGGDIADTALVTAATDEGVAVLAVELDRSGCSRTIRRSMDGTRGFADLTFDDATATMVAEPGAGDAALRRALDVGAAMLANEMVGAAQSCLEMTVDYARDREQFGRPIGSFQAIKHDLAECFVAVEGATATAHYAAWAAEHDPEELAVVAPVAKFVAGEAYFRTAGDAIQIHGGIGFTWEHDAHLFFKHAKTSLMLHGDSDRTLEALADRLAL